VATLPGTPGYGKKIVNAFKDRAGTEAEISDLVDLANWTRGLDYVDQERVYLAGEGYGGALALLLPGARPGAVDAVAVIDPVTDWDDELDQADDEFAHWYLTALGLPSTNRGRSALRTPTTFAGVLDLPVLLVGSSRANLGRAVQLERFAAALDELGVPYVRETAENESTWQTAERVAAFLGAPTVPKRVAKPAEAALAESEPTEPGFVIEPVETVDIESLLIGNSNGNAHDEPALDAASTDELRVVEDVAVEQVPEDLPKPGSPAEVVAASQELPPGQRIDAKEPLPVSSNVGRGMRTDEI